MGVQISVGDSQTITGAINMVDYYCNHTDNLSNVKKILVDGGYTSQNFADEIKGLSVVVVEVVKHNELNTFAVIQKR